MLNNHSQLVYLFFRLGLGINFFFHGLIKLTNGLDNFVNHIQSSFADMLPSLVINVYANALPYMELGLGLLLILGLFTVQTLIGILITMISLNIGMILQESWSTVTDHLIYILYAFLLYANINLNTLSLDSILGITPNPKVQL